MYTYNSGDRFLKKEWWTIRAPGMFALRDFTKSPVNQTQGKKLSKDAMKGRVYEANFNDLSKDTGVASKKIKFIVEEAEEGSRLAQTNFYGMDTTRDHLCSLIKKWHTLIDVFVDCKTSDGFLLRFFVTCFTARQKQQLKATTFAQRSQVKHIRAIIKKCIVSATVRSTLKELVGKILGDKLPLDMEQKCKKIFPIENCIIRKVKTIKRPRFDITQLMSMQTDSELAGVEKKKEENANGNLIQ